MRKLAAIVALALSLALMGGMIGAALAASPSGVIVLDDDDGGGVDDHVKFYKRIGLAGTPVEVRGICISSCTLVLMLPREQVCIASTGSFGFHLATYGDKPAPEMTRIFALRYYPQAVRDWIAAFVAEHGPQRVNRIDYMDAETVVSLGILPACED